MASTSVRARPGRFLPPDPRVETPYRLTPQLLFRIGILGFLTLAAFGVLFFRLWALQVLSGTQYLRAAQNNQQREVPVEAPRGPILDRDGRVLVTNAGATAVQIWPADLPRKGAYAELKRLARILDVPLGDVTRQIGEHKGDPVTPVTVKEGLRRDEVFFLLEHKSEFPGMRIANTYLRRYPFGELAAQSLGYVGEISPQQLKHMHGYRLGDKIGQGGIEAPYDKFIRGQAGLSLLRVDSLGRPTSEPEQIKVPRGGYAVRLTLDAKLQQAAERAITYGIGLAHGNHNWAANGGAVVALDPRDGAIRALASYPTYNPGVFSGRTKRRELAPLLNQEVAQEQNFPALNRAIAGVYPPGSAFKPVTALAAMQEHILAPYDALPCVGQVTIAKQVFKNWNPYVNEAMTLPTAIAQSCDTYFYEVGRRFYDLPADRGQPLQRWARSFGFGQPSGLDVGPEQAGLLPTIQWRRQTYTRKTDPCCWEVDRLWKPGDSIQLAIGQKDLQVTPLQMARFYALIANGGKLVTPHLVADIENTGQKGSPTGPLVLRRFAPPPKELAVDADAIGVIREGLYQATHATSGTSAGVFGHFPVAISGKTGTAEKQVDLGSYVRLTDQSWWCGYGPSSAARLVVCAVIENGGFGGEAAAPAALKVFEQYFGFKAASVAPARSD